MAVAPTRVVTLIGATNQGSVITFQHILSLYLDADRFTPADSLECSVLDPIIGNQKFATITLRADGAELFSGYVDVQTRTIGRKGSYTSFVCRSKAALMLDNEVKPYWYMSMSSDQLIRTHAIPYGATGGKLPYSATIAQILAKKGLSHWAFIEQFCRAAYQKRPYLNSKGIITCEPFQNTLHRFSNVNQQAIPFLDAQIKDDRYNMISKLYIKTGKDDYGGSYKYIVNNIGAQRLGVRRERYYHPEAAWQDSALISGKALLEDKQLDYFEIILTVSGIWEIRVGDSAEFYDGAGWHENLYVSQIRQSSDSNGNLTRLCLWNKRAILEA